MAVAKRLINFGPNKIIYHNRKKNPDADQFGFKYVDMSELLNQSDFLICTSSLTNETQNLFDLKLFRKMKKDSIFINVSRGNLVNQEDLAQALKNNLILAAGNI